MTTSATMPIQSDQTKGDEISPWTPTAYISKADLGCARVRDTAYDAIFALWTKRKAEGLTQKEVAAALGRDPAWVSRALRGPANWTIGTLGELSEALNGLVKIEVDAREDLKLSNYDIYADVIDSHLHVYCPVIWDSSDMPSSANKNIGITAKASHGKSFNSNVVYGAYRNVGHRHTK